MEANSTSNNTSETHSTPVLDSATLYLCRQGQTWVVVLESPRITAALLLRHAGRDGFDARFELLSRARTACPGADIETADGAVEGADYEWRLEVRGVQQHAGDLGLALQQELSGKRQRQRHQRRLATRVEARGCREGWFLSPSGRPLSF